MKILRFALIILMLSLFSCAQGDGDSSNIEKHPPEYLIAKIFYSLNAAWWRKSGLVMFGAN